MDDVFCVFTEWTGSLKLPHSSSRQRFLLFAFCFLLLKASHCYSGNFIVNFPYFLHIIPLNTEQSLTGVNMADTLQPDNLDRGILNALLDNARIAYAELAKQFNVSPGTIHVRVEKMKQAGIIKGTRVDIDPKQLGYDVCCFIGIILKSAKDYPSALARLEALDEVVEAYYTTGHYSIFIKVMCRSIDHLQQVLINKVQTIDEIQSTETLISLQNPIMRPIKP